MCGFALCCSREVSSGFFYSSAGEREKLVSSERKFTDEKVGGRKALVPRNGTSTSSSSSSSSSSL